MNLILENSKYVNYYTYLDEILEKVDRFLSCWWLITEIELNYYTDADDIFKQDALIIDGQTLLSKIKDKQIQFIWAVLSGFKEKPIKLPKNLPFANGNKDFWTGSPKPQIKGAEFEIVCFDSSFTLFIGVDQEIHKQLLKIYPDIQILENRKKVIY